VLRFFIIRVILPILLFTLVRAVLRSIFQGVRTAVTPQTKARESPPLQVGGELTKDPVCGTYVSTAVAITRTVNGRAVHFCSKECRDKYRAA